MIEIKIDSSGVERRLKEMKENAEKLDGENNVPFQELFNPAFMRKYTNFQNIDDMLENSGFKIESQEDFEAIDDLKWDEYVRKNTRFQNWHEMMSEATSLWALKQMGF